MHAPRDCAYRTVMRSDDTSLFNATSNAIPIEGIEGSVQEGFTLLWRVDRYEVTASRLKVAEFLDPPKWFAPAGLPRIAADIAQLHGAGDVEILAFANAFGLLGHGQLLSRPFSPEPLDWIRAAGQSLEHVLALAHMQENEEATARYLHALRVPNHGTVPPYWPTVTTIEGPAIKTLSVPDQESARATANGLVRAILNPGLRRISHRLVDGPANSLQVTLQFTALVDVAFWHASTLFGRADVVGKCPCGRYFVRQHKRQKFCPPRPVEHPNTESACGRRFRARHYRGGVK